MAPLDLLHLKGAAATGAGVRLETQAPGRSYSMLSIAGTAPRLSFIDNTATKERMVIAGSGNIGIGTVNPLDLLHLVGAPGVGANGVRIETQAPGRSYSILSIAGSDPRLSFVDNSGSSERMVIDANGDVGIGTVAPGANLEVAGGYFKISRLGYGIVFPDGSIQNSACSGNCSAGTITGVTAGTDLTGGGTKGTVTLNLNVAALETTLDARYVQIGSQSLMSTTVVTNYTYTTNLGCPSGYGVLVASCNAGINVVLNEQFTIAPPGGSWVNWLTPGVSNATGVHCSIGFGNSSQAQLRCQKLQ